MHRLIVPDYLPHIDHKNGDGLDNQKDNLRAATRSQNTANSRTRSDSVSGIRGVGKSGRKWRALITCGGTSYHLGNFETQEEAATMYGLAAIELHGEFARLV